MNAISCRKRAVANKKKTIRRCYRKYHLLIEWKLRRVKSQGFILTVDLDDEWLTYTAAQAAAHILYVKYGSLGFDVSILGGAYISVAISLPDVVEDNG